VRELFTDFKGYGAQSTKKSNYMLQRPINLSGERILIDWKNHPTVRKF